MSTDIAKNIAQNNSKKQNPRELNHTTKKKANKRDLKINETKTKYTISSRRDTL